LLDSRVLAGIKAFNQGEYYTAHELWESVWREAVPPEKGYYQGLIQAAMALYHLDRGNAVGASRLAGRALQHLSGFPSGYLGVDVSEIKQYLQSFSNEHPHEVAKSGDANSNERSGECRAFPRLIVSATVTDNK